MQAWAQCAQLPDALCHGCADLHISVQAGLVSSWLFNNMVQGIWILWKAIEGSFTPQVSCLLHCSLHMQTQMVAWTGGSAAEH